MSAADRDAEARTARWVQRVVVGLDLCPFAAAPWRAGRVRVTTCDGDPIALVAAAAAEVTALVDTPESTLSSTLLVATRAMDFETFLDVVATVEDLLMASAADQTVQLAHFHPDYRFDGVAADDVGNATNRSPLPTLHLLRVTEVEAALERFGRARALAIPEHNQRTLARVGFAGLAALLDDDEPGVEG